MLVEFKYRVYLEGRTFDTTFKALSMNEGAEILKAQFGAHEVIGMGSV